MALIFRGISHRRSADDASFQRPPEGWKVKRRSSDVGYQFLERSARGKASSAPSLKGRVSAIESDLETLTLQEKGEGNRAQELANNENNSFSRFLQLYFSSSPSRFPVIEHLIGKRRRFGLFRAPRIEAIESQENFFLKLESALQKPLKVKDRLALMAEFEEMIKILSDPLALPVRIEKDRFFFCLLRLVFDHTSEKLLSFPALQDYTVVQGPIHPAVAARFFEILNANKDDFFNNLPESVLEGVNLLSKEIVDSISKVVLSSQDWMEWGQCIQAVIEFYKAQPQLLKETSEVSMRSLLESMIFFLINFNADMQLGTRYACIKSLMGDSNLSACVNFDRIFSMLIDKGRYDERLHQFSFHFPYELLKYCTPKGILALQPTGSGPGKNERQASVFLERLSCFPNSNNLCEYIKKLELTSLQTEAFIRGFFSGYTQLSSQELARAYDVLYSSLLCCNDTEVEVYRGLCTSLVGNMDASDIQGVNRYLAWQERLCANFKNSPLNPHKIKQLLSFMLDVFPAVFKRQKENNFFDNIKTFINYAAEGAFPRDLEQRMLCRSNLVGALVTYHKKNNIIFVLLAAYFPVEYLKCSKCSAKKFAERLLDRLSKVIQAQSEYEYYIEKMLTNILNAEVDLESTWNVYLPIVVRIKPNPLSEGYLQSKTLFMSFSEASLKVFYVYLKERGYQDLIQTLFDRYPESFFSWVKQESVSHEEFQHLFQHTSNLQETLVKLCQKRRFANLLKVVGGKDRFCSSLDPDFVKSLEEDFYYNVHLASGSGISKPISKDPTRPLPPPPDSKIQMESLLKLVKGFEKFKATSFDYTTEAGTTLHVTSKKLVEQIKIMIEKVKTKAIYGVPKENIALYTLIENNLRSIAYGLSTLLASKDISKEDKKAKALAMFYTLYHVAPLCVAPYTKDLPEAARNHLGTILEPEETVISENSLREHILQVNMGWIKTLADMFFSRVLHHRVIYQEPVQEHAEQHAHSALMIKLTEHDVPLPVDVKLLKQDPFALYYLAQYNKEGSNLKHFIGNFEDTHNLFSLVETVRVDLEIKGLFNADDRIISKLHDWIKTSWRGFSNKHYEEKTSEETITSRVYDPKQKKFIESSRVVSTKSTIADQKMEDAFYQKEGESSYHLRHKVVLDLLHNYNLIYRIL